MRDRDIRTAIWARLEAEHRDDPETLILDELGVCEGAARADIAVINGSLAAFEIKSERDTLARLPGQIAAYQRVFDAVTIVVSDRHGERVEELVPASWGLSWAVQSGRGAELEIRRPPTRNPEVDPFALAQLLWREEALALLEDRGLAEGRRSKPRRVLWEAIASELSLEEVGAAVRDQLKARADWRGISRASSAPGRAR